MDNQTTDLQTSQNWLRSMVWQLSMQNTCITSSSQNPTMQYQHSLDLLMAITNQFPQQSVDVHGVGLVVCRTHSLIPIKLTIM